ncbi:MAG: LamG domain-containing protein [Bdellovibrionales bacterium]|nr:LamG domain-containing protein [Bdellovibrionales bacterium]
MVRMMGNSLFRILIAVGIVANLVACKSEKGSEEVQNKEYGLNLKVIGGDNQYTAPNQLFSQPLMIMASNVDGKPASGLDIDFSILSGAGYYLTLSQTKTSAGGTAFTEVRAPSEFDVKGIVEARVRGTNVSVTFNLSSNNSVPGLRFSLETTSGTTVSAGDTFGFILKLVDSDNVVSDYSGTIVTIWNVITGPTWTGTQPQNVPTAFACTFSHGICVLPVNTVLVDARNVTTIYVGDGNGGYIDVFAYDITVTAKPASAIVIADNTGGPANGALPVKDRVITTDHAPINLTTALVDSVGNYISDGGSATWTSDKTAISDYFSGSIGTSVVYSPTKTVSYPAFGYIYANVAGYPQVASGKITVDPGVPSRMEVYSKDGSINKTGGQPFRLGARAVDAKGNVVSSSTAKPAGYTGYFNVSTVWTNHLSGTTPSGGDVPIRSTIVTYNGVDYPVDLTSKLFNPSPTPSFFVLGEMQDLLAADEYIFLFDATSVSPKFTISADATADWPALNGEITMNMTVGPPSHIGLRKASGDSDSYCPAVWTGPPNMRGGLYSKQVLSGATGKSDCQFGFVAGVPSDFHFALEDAGGNFISNFNVDVNTTATTTGNFSPTSSTPFSTFYKENVDDIDFSVSGTYASVMYWGHYEGKVAEAALHHIKLSIIENPAYYGQVLSPNGSVRTTHSFGVAAVFYDEFDNCLHQASGGSVNFSYSPAGPFQPSPDLSTPAYMPPQGAVAVGMINSPYTCAGVSFTVGGRLPNISDSGLQFTATHSDPAVLGDTRSVTILPGALAVVDIRTAYGAGGSSVVGTPITITTDNNTTYYGSGFDTLGNFASSPILSWELVTPSDPTAVTYNDTGSSTFIQPLRPMTAAKLRATYDRPNPQADLVVETGLFTVNAGQLDNVLVEVPPGAKSAGVPFAVNIHLRDAKGNDLNYADDLRQLNFAVLNNANTRLNYNHSQPLDGLFLFSDGVASGLNFTLYNSARTPRIQVTSTEGALFAGGSTAPITVTSQAVDHLHVLSEFNQISAGGTNTFTLFADDIWGNAITSGLGSDMNVQFDLTTPLATRDIINTTLTNTLPASIAGATDTTIQGQLTAGTATVTMTSTKAGMQNIDAHGLSVVLNEANNVETPVEILPLPTVSSLQWKVTKEPPSTHNASATTPILPFTAQLLDAYQNVIYTNNSDDIHVAVVGSQPFFSGTATRQVASGEAQFDDLKYTRAETITLRAEYQPDPTKKVEKVVNVNVSGNLSTLVEMPNQVFTEGTGDIATALTGTPFGGGSQINAGSNFNIKVRLVDEAFNTLTTFNGGTVTLSSATDPYLIAAPASTSFSSGVANFNVTVRRTGTHQILATADLTPNKIASTAFTVDPIAATQLVAILPGQTLSSGAPDLATAISGTPSNTLVSGTPFTVDVFATDPYFNQNLSASGTSISLVTSDANDSHPGNQTLASGLATFSVNNLTASLTHTLTPSGTGLTGNISETYAIKAGNATQCIAKLPGQTHVPGKSTYVLALTGAVTNRTAGTTFNAEVYAVDAYFNIDSTYAGSVSIDTPSDPTDTPPAGTSFTSGQKTLTVDPVTASSGQSLTLSCPTLSVNNPASYNVVPGAKAFLISLFPDYQTFNPGQTSLANAVTPQTAQNRNVGTGFTVRVIGTDNRYNIINDSSTTVTLSSSDANFIVSPSSSALASGQRDFTLTNYRAGSGYIAQASGTSYAGAPSTTYNTLRGTPSKMLVILPGQTFVSGQATSAAAASGTPFNQTVGSNFPFNIRIIATDDYYNQITDDSSSVVAPLPSGGPWTMTSASQLTLAGGEATFQAYHTGGGVGSFTVNPSQVSGTNTYTGVLSKNYQVLAALGDPTLSLQDAITSSTSYTRSVLLNPGIGSDSTASYWCLSETQTTRPSSGTNSRLTCTGGAGGDIGWNTSRPPSMNVSSGDGSKSVYLWVADSAQNVSLGTVNDTITLDATAPSSPTISVSDPVTLSTTFTKTSTPNISITGEPADISQWCVIEQPAASAAPSQPLYNNACWGTEPSQVTLGALGSRKVYVYLKDLAQNVSSTAAVHTMFYDTSAPGAFTITGVRGNSDTVADNLLGTTTNPTVEWSAASDASTVTYNVVIKNLSSTVMCSGPTTATSLALVGCGLANGTTYTIEIAATDEVTNASNASNNGYSFSVDTTAPNAFSVTGATGGSDVTANDYLTSGTNVTVNWNDTSGEDRYDVTILNSNDTVKCTLQSVAANAVTAAFGGCALTNNVTYKMKVVAYDNAGNSTEATNSPMLFTVSIAASNYLVQLTAGGNKVAGTAFDLTVTARKPDGTTDTSVNTPRNVTLTTTAGNGLGTCGSGDLTPLFPTVINFAAGVGTANVNLKKAETGVSITVTDDVSSWTGTLTGVNVDANVANCTRIADAASAAGAVLTTLNLSIDQEANLYSNQYDLYGNFVIAASSSWTGTGIMQYVPHPITGSQSKISGSRAGAGTVSIGGSSVTVNVTTGSATWTIASQDSTGNYFLSAASQTASHFWEPVMDVSSAWRTAGTQSWYSESHVANVRGSRAEFPARVMILASTNNLDIVDLTSNKLFMRFNIGVDYAIDSDLGSISEVVAKEGKIFVGMRNSGGGTGGVILLDFANDQMFQISNTVTKSNKNLSQRNSAGVWSVDTSFAALINKPVNDLDVIELSGNVYLAVATDNGPYLLKVNSTSTAYTNTASTGKIQSIALSTAGELYYAEQNLGIYRSNLSLPLAANFSANYTYTRSTNAGLAGLDFSQLALSQNTSTNGNNTVLIASPRGLSVIDENFTNNTLADLQNFSYTGTGSLPFSGILNTDGSSGYIVASGSGSLTNTLTIEMWFRPDQLINSGSGSPVLMLRGTNGVNGSYGFDFLSGRLEFWVRHSGADYTVTSSATSWNAGAWVYVAATVNGSSGMKMWVNGTLQGTNAVNLSTWDADDNSLYLGGDGTDYFNGAIDEFRLSSSVLYSTASITVPSSALTSAGAVYHYHFDESDGLTATASAGATGTLNAGAWFSKMLLAGTGHAVADIQPHTSGAIAVGEVVTSGSAGARSRLYNLQSTGASLIDSDTAIHASHIELTRKITLTQKDYFYAIPSSGATLKRH